MKRARTCPLRTKSRPRLIKDWKTWALKLQTRGTNKSIWSLLGKRRKKRSSRGREKNLPKDMKMDHSLIKHKYMKRVI